ncbi:MAG: zinc-binding dehydrogenase [Sedimentisphaerales bacterium]|nr:zinc-binding dehydrogenase [Sedimentisphaerales bacterium]
MKAAVIYEHGGLDQVKIDDVPKPVFAEDEVLVKVLSAGLNHLDIWVRHGRGDLKLPKPHILGSDACGVIVAAGKSVKNVRVGDEVVLNPGLSCGKCENCKHGQESECVSFGILGLTRPGTFAEMVAIPAQNLLPKPSHLNFDEAGALMLSFVTAWRMLMTKAKLQPSQKVLIHGIGGGVALCALQLAKLTEAEVIATSSSDEKLQRAARIGADHLINYKKVSDVAKRIKDITAGFGVDIVIDTVGAAAWPIDFSAVRKGGKIVLCGVTTGAEAQTNLRALYWNQLTVMGSTMGSNDDCRQMLKAVEAAKLKSIIDSVLPLENAREAMGKMETGKQFGKIVLSVSG